MLIALGFICGLASAKALAQRYDLVGFGSLDRGSEALSVNEKGQVAGYSDAPSGPTQAVLWANGHLIALGPISASDVNNIEIAVGQDENTLAVLWKRGQTVLLGTLPQFSHSRAVAINDRVQVACNAWDGSGRFAAFVWEDSNMRELGTLGGGKCTAEDINNAMQVVGNSSTPSGLEHAFVWQDGMMTDLGLLEGDRTSYAVAINDNGDAVGWSTGAAGDTPCAWINNEIQTLPHLVGDRWTLPHDINNNGLIVGTASTTELGERAVMWQNGEVIDLNQYAFGTTWVLRGALDVNDRGWIVGTGLHAGVLEGYILIPSPTLDAGDFVAGQPVDVVYTNGTPNDLAYLAYSLSGFGSTYIPRLGVELQLNRPLLAASGRTDSQGSVTWTLDVPPGTGGVRVLLQAAQTGRTSNVLSDVIE